MSTTHAWILLAREQEKARQAQMSPAERQLSLEEKTQRRALGKAQKEKILTLLRKMETEMDYRMAHIENRLREIESWWDKARPLKSYTLQEFCNEHHLKRSTYDRLHREGKTPAEVRIGRARFILLRDAEIWREQILPTLFPPTKRRKPPKADRTEYDIGIYDREQPKKIGIYDALDEQQKTPL